MHAADQVWRLLRGLWQVRVMESNRSALEFWERAIAAFTGEIIPPNRIEKDGTHWRVFSFESTHVSARQQDPPASHGVPE